MRIPKFEIMLNFKDYYGTLLVFQQKKVTAAYLKLKIRYLSVSHAQIIIDCAKTDWHIPLQIVCI